jgi:hypothetical protein
MIDIVRDDSIQVISISISTSISTSLAVLSLYIYFHLSELQSCDSPAVLILCRGIPVPSPDVRHPRLRPQRLPLTDSPPPAYDPATLLSQVPCIPRTGARALHTTDTFIRPQLQPNLSQTTPRYRICGSKPTRLWDCCRSRGGLLTRAGMGKLLARLRTGESYEVGLFPRETVGGVKSTTRPCIRLRHNQGFSLELSCRQLMNSVPTRK